MIYIDASSGSPKYRQIIRSVELALLEKRLKLGDRLPSINTLCAQHGLSQDTVMAAYSELKARGILSATVGKGYFVANDDISQNRKVFLLFDNLTPYKEVLHSAFQQAIGTAAITDLYFHHGNAKMAANLLQEASGHYTDYAIMPLDHPLFQAAMQSLPRQHIIILDQGRLSFGHQYSSICQNFEKDVFLALIQGLPLLKKYSTLNFCSRDQRGHFQELLHGCARFCAEHGISFRHQTAVSDLLKAGEAWLVMHDKDLVEIVKMSREAGLNLGQELGLISYNDIPMKEVIADGITTISTDFAQMGTALAAAIQQRGQVQIENPSRLIIRKSL